MTTVKTKAGSQLGALIDFYNKIKHTSPTNVAEQLFSLRVSSRRSPSSQEWLNDLVKHRISELKHHIHPLYLDLLDCKLNKQQMETFLSEYYWASSYAFQREVINVVYTETSNPSLKEYLRYILKEEQDPRPHQIIFSELIVELGMQVQERKKISHEFSAKQYAAYSGNTHYTFGYMLGVEVEADYQIGLLACALSNSYLEAVHNNCFFDVHIDPSGEEAHAIATCELIESHVSKESELKELAKGFDQAICDTSDMLTSIRGIL